MSSVAPAHVRGEQAARAVRQREQIGFDAVDIWQLLDSIGVPVALHEFGDSTGDGLYLWESEEPLIVVNASCRPSRQRFTAAHELGHHEMHRFGHPHLIIADQNIYGSEDEREQEANAFAAYLLAPDEAIRRAVGAAHGSQITADQVVELMGRFGLSYEATTWRLVNTGVITRAERDVLAANASVEARQRRLNVREDGMFMPQSELPRAHVNAALRLYEDHVVSADRLAELLDMAPDKAIAFAQQRGVCPDPELPVDDDTVGALAAGKRNDTP
jgi:Zn-dependent peptidase ImmA (M78 family)